MGLVVADRVQETTTSVGTGAVTLAGAVAGYQAFDDVCADGDVVVYCIAHRTPGQWEVGRGSWAAGVLTRSEVLASSNSGAAVSFAAGTKDVFLTTPAQQSGPFSLIQKEVIITAAEFKVLNTSPKTVAPADPDAYYVIRHTSWRKPLGVQFGISGVTALHGRVGTAAQTNTGTPTGVALAPLWNIVMWGPGNSGVLFSGTDLVASGLSNAAVNLFAAGANPQTIVDGEIHVDIGYHRIPVS